jgi:sulfide:quinone oxidoreductase
MLISLVTPRTGIPSGIIGKVIVLNFTDEIKSGKMKLRHKALMGRMGAAG